MKKLIQTLLIIVLTLVIALVVIFVFNPYNLRTKLVGGVINSYLSSTIKDYEPLKKDADTSDNADTSGSVTTAEKHPLLNEEQQKALEDYGVNVSQLPSSISPEMEACFVEKLGEARTQEIVEGDSPIAIEVFKSRSCLGE